jgi:hypothetical protein
MAKKKSEADPSTVTTLGTVLFTLAASINESGENFSDISDEQKEDWEDLAHLFTAFVAAHADQVLALVDPIDEMPSLVLN